MYVHSSIMVNTLLLSPSGLEFMLVCLLTPHVSAVLVYCIYHPPNSPTSIFEILYLHLLRININIFSNFVLLGDCNVNYNKSSHPLFIKLCTNNYC